MLERYSESETVYQMLISQFNKEEGKIIAKYIFGMILMPLEVDRKVSN